MNRAREREAVRHVANGARALADALIENDVNTNASVVGAIRLLADAVEKLADISEDQEAS